MSGDLESVGAPGSAQSFWRASTRDASLRIRDEVYGEVYDEPLVKRTLTYHPLFGRLETAEAQKGVETIQGLSLVYDDGANLIRRTDGAAGTVESYSHDILGRLRYWSSQYGQFNVEYQYDDLGNMTMRQTTRHGVPGESELFGYHGRSPEGLSTYKEESLLVVRAGG